MARNYIPGNDAEFDNWFFYMFKYVEARTNPPAPVWDHIPARFVLELDGALSNWRAHYTPTLMPHTPAQTVGKRAARREAEAVIRPFVQRFLLWPPVTDEDRVNMKIPNHDKTRTENSAPTKQPNTLVENTVNHFEHKVIAVTPDTGLPKKPAGVHGVRYAWQIGGEKPPRGGKLADDKFTLRTHYIIRYDESNKGKTVFIATCYENRKGDPGPWSEIVEAVIG